MANDVQNAVKIHFKPTPKIRGSKIFGGVALFKFAPFVGGNYPYFTSAYYGPKYIDKKSFYSAGIAFHLAEIWNFKVSKCWTLSIFANLRPFTMG